MATKLTAESFQAILRQSGLISEDQLDKTLQQIDSDKVDLEDPCAVAQELVERGLLTLWQADKLLKGKHKGFVLGKYRLLSLLGKGGMSSVYLAEHLVMRRRVAIKVLPAKRVNDTSYLARFHREAQAVAALDHPNIVRAYDVDQEIDGGTEIHFIVMEYVDGQSLHDLVVTRGAMGYAEAAEVVRQAADGLSHAHAAGMVHRDIKPGNLLIDSSGVVKILDLGLARFFEEQENESLTIAHEEKVLGTADYLAPEQALDSHKVDLRADIYSLGCTIYFLLTGHPPFTEGTLTQRLMCHQTKEPPPIENDRPDAPQSLMVMIRKMMAKNPDGRFQTAADVSEAFAEWLQHHSDEDWKQRPQLSVGSSADSRLGSSIIAPGSSVHATLPAGSSKPSSPTKQPSSIVPLAADSDIEKSSPVKKPPGRESAETDADMASSDTLKQPSSKSVHDESDSDPELASTSSKKLSPASSRKQPSVKQPASSKTQPASAKQPPAAKKPPSSKKPAGSTKQPASTKKAETPGRQPVKPVSGKRTAGDSSAGRRTGSAVAASRSGPRLPLAEADEPAEAILEPIKIEPIRKPPSSTGLSGIGSSISSGADNGEDRSLVVTAIVLVSVLAFAVITYFVLSGIGKGPDAADIRVDRPRSTTQSTPATPTSSYEYSVGPAGQADFQTIARGLKAIRDSVRPSNANEPRTLRITGGRTYTERVRIDNSDPSYPRNLTIVSTGDEPAILAPGGDDPVVLLKDAEQLHLDGFEIKAAGKPVAVELQGRMFGTRLSGLRISGFGGTGIVGVGVAGSSRAGEIQIEDCVFQSESSDAEAIRFKDGGFPTHSLKLSRLQVIGPMRAGIVFSTGVDTDAVMISDSSFTDLNVGILIEGSQRRLREVVIRNNEFVNLDRGIVTEQMPLQTSEEVNVTGNRFINVKGPEAVVEEGFSNDDWKKIVAKSTNHIRRNLSTRPADQAGQDEIDLFINGGRRGVPDLKPKFQLILDPDATETNP